MCKTNFSVVNFYDGTRSAKEKRDTTIISRGQIAIKYGCPPSFFNAHFFAMPICYCMYNLKRINTKKDFFLNT